MNWRIKPKSNLEKLREYFLKYLAIVSTCSGLRLPPSYTREKMTFLFPSRSACYSLNSFMISSISSGMSFGITVYDTLSFSLRLMCASIRDFKFGSLIVFMVSPPAVPFCHFIEESDFFGFSS